MPRLRLPDLPSRPWLPGLAVLAVAVLSIEALRPATEDLRLEEASGLADAGTLESGGAVEPVVDLTVERHPSAAVWREITLRNGEGLVLNSVRLAEPPQRIVSQTAASDDLLLQLVPISRIAALSSYSASPATSLDLAKALQVGRFVTNNAEQILGLDPDLVIAAAYSAPELLHHLFATETPVLQLQSFAGWRDIRRNIELIGLAVDAETEAALLIDESNRRLAAVGERRARAEAVRALAYTYGNAQARGSTFDEVLRLCAARNVASEAGLQGWTSIDLEQIAAWQPDIVFLSSEAGQERTVRERFLQQPVLRQTHLAEPGRVVVISGALFGTVSHRYVDLVELVAQALDAIAPPAPPDNPTAETRI